MDLFGPTGVAARAAEAEAAASVKKKRRRGGKRGGKKHGYNSDEEKSSSFPRPAKKQAVVSLTSVKTADMPSKKVEDDDDEDEGFKVHTKSENTLTPKFTAHSRDSSASGNASKTWLSNHEVVSLNNSIAEHAQRKQLAAAVEAFEQLSAVGAANSISYAAVVNAHVRCGDIPGAVSRLEQAKAAGRKPCVVLYTSLLKGYCGDGGGAHGGLASAWDVVSELRAKRVQPNIRMVNTLLRGCLLNGDPDKALEVLRGMTNCGKAVGFIDADAADSAKKKKNKKNKKTSDQQEPAVKVALPSAGSCASAVWGEVGENASFVWQPTPCDGSSFEYACSLLAQALRADEAERLVQWASKQAKVVTSSSSANATPAGKGKQTPAAMDSAASDKKRSGKSGNGKGAETATAAVTEEAAGGENGAGPTDGSGGLELHAARAHALLGDWGRARPLLRRAQKLASKHAAMTATAAKSAEVAAEASVAAAASSYWGSQGTESEWGDSSNRNGGSGARALSGSTGGGQRGGRRAEGNCERERSNAVYRAHRDDILLADIASLKSFVDRYTATDAAASAISDALLLTEAQKRKRAAAEAECGGPIVGPMPDLRPIFARTLLFPSSPIVSEEAAAPSKEEGGEASTACSSGKKGGAGAFGKPAWVKTTCAAMEQRLNATLGYSRFAIRWEAAQARAAALAAGKSPDAAASAASAAAAAAVTAAQARVAQAGESGGTGGGTGGAWGGASVLDGQGHVRWGAVFPGAAHRPLKLEFGAGTGDWAFAQAQHDAQLAITKADGTLGGGGGNWCAVELRADRVAATFAKVALQLEPPAAPTSPQAAAATGNVPAESSSIKDVSSSTQIARPAGWNLAVAHVGAMVLLNRHIRPGSISAVFVNHPEPPQQRSWGAADGAASGDAASEASHMCDKAFFVAVRAALGVGGRFTIVTDNEWYARLLLATAAELCDLKKLFKGADLTVDPATQDTSGVAHKHEHDGKGGKGGKGGRGRGGRGIVNGRSGGRGGGGRGGIASASQPPAKHPGLVPRAANALKVHTTTGSCSVFVGGSGVDLSAAGHAPVEEGAAKAGSWFDGLWQKDKRTARYALSLIAI